MYQNNRLKTVLSRLYCTCMERKKEINTLSEINTEVKLQPRNLFAQAIPFPLFDCHQ